MDLWWGFLRLCRTRRQQASIFCICCRLPSRGPFRGTAPGRGKTDNRSQIFLLFSPAPPSTRGFRSAPAKERPRLETNITTQHQRGRVSRVMSPGGMAVGNGMRVPEKFGSSKMLLAPGSSGHWAVRSWVLQGVSTADPDIPQPAEIARHTHFVPRPRVKLPESQRHLTIRLQVVVFPSQVNLMPRTGCRVQIVHITSKKIAGRESFTPAKAGTRSSNYYVSN